MGLLDRMFGGGEQSPVPDWASFFDSGQYREFCRLLDEELMRRGLDCEIEEDRQSARILSGDNKGSTLGFYNLAQVCHGVPRRRWKDAIRQHFDRILTTVSATESLTSHLEENFDHAKTTLRVRLYPDEMEGMEKSVSRRIADGIQAILVFDFPESVVGVIRENISGWGKSDDELFEIALANHKAEFAPTPLKLPGQDGASVYGIFDDSSLYAATSALYLQDFLPSELDLGAIVAVPNRHAVLYHPIVDSNAIGALQSIIPAAMGMFEQGPGSISRHVYWWQNGVFQRQPVEVTDSSLEFNPTEEFIFQVLNRIRPPE